MKKEKEKKGWNEGKGSHGFTSFIFYFIFHFYL